MSLTLAPQELVLRLAYPQAGNAEECPVDTFLDMRPGRRDSARDDHASFYTIRKVLSSFFKVRHLSKVGKQQEQTPSGLAALPNGFHLSQDDAVKDARRIVMGLVRQALTIYLVGRGWKPEQIPLDFRRKTAGGIRKITTGMNLAGWEDLPKSVPKVPKKKKTPKALKTAVACLDRVRKRSSRRLEEKKELEKKQDAITKALEDMVF